MLFTQPRRFAPNRTLRGKAVGIQVKEYNFFAVSETNEYICVPKNYAYAKDENAFQRKKTLPPDRIRKSQAFPCKLFAPHAQQKQEGEVEKPRCRLGLCGRRTSRKAHARRRIIAIV
jgi:hypothetical protein